MGTRKAGQLRKELAHQADVAHAREALGMTDEQKMIKEQNDSIILLAMMDEI